MKAAIIFAVFVLYVSLYYALKPIELSGMDELKHALKNYTVITK